MTSSARDLLPTDDHAYVLVVHGTWSARKPGRVSWYQLNDHDPNNFCQKLNELLAEGPLGRAVWRQNAGAPTEFNWSGANDHEERLKASRELFSLLNQILLRDGNARIHIVSHSHGGNVTLNAVEQYLCALKKEAYEIYDSMPSLDDTAVRLSQLRNTAKRYLGSKAENTDAIEFVNRLRNIDRNDFAEQWMSSRVSNRLGRLVFLGTPFYRKIWCHGHRSKLAFALGTFLFTLPLTAIVFYLIGVVGAFVLELFNATVLDSPEYLVNPLAWPRIYLWILCVLCIALVILLAVVSEDEWTRDTNIYFDELAVRPFADQPPRGLQLGALVISAGILDEAFLALSAEPIVYGTFLPRLRSLLNPKARWGLSKPKIGVNDQSPGQWGLTGYHAIRTVVRNLFLPVVGFIFSPLRHLAEHILTNLFLNIILSAASGLPPVELENAHLSVRSRLNIPGIFGESYWEVSKILGKNSEPESQKSLHSRVGVSGDSFQARYSFLWNLDDFEKQKGQSWLWKQISALDPRILKRRSATSLSEDQISVASTCLTLEERLKEIVGQVDLTHSSYYTNSRILGVIAEFLESGRVSSS